MEILKRIGPKGTLLAIDWDEELLKKFKEKTKNYKTKIIYAGENYANIPKVLKKYGLGKADGLLLDLGFSSEHLESGRGFSFKKNEPLDMRYSIKNKLTAAEVVNTTSEKDLADIFFKYGEERFARRISGGIVSERKNKRILTSGDLVEIIKKYGGGANRINPATRVFQALRIYVNKELENLQAALNNLPAILKPGGRAAVISFHSLEDRIVKNNFRQMKSGHLLEIAAKKPVVPSIEECSRNPRSCSAKLRAAILI